jgi:drug/metabolite transporter (DMT)-like permease
LTPVYTVLALMSFAANSILCRLALGGGAIDAASFTTIRLVSGAVTLLLLSRLIEQSGGSARGLDVEASRTPGWRSVAALFAYAIAFSYAYVSLTTGTGALILFGCVQTTMLGVAIRSGERPRPLEWLALASAVTGLVVLVFPGLTAPSLPGSLTMIVAGVSWGFYSLWGRGSSNPLKATTMNFARTVPLTALASLIAIATVGGFTTTRGAVLAVASGAVASGLGYVVWYAALRGLTATRAALVQTGTPIITAAGGVVFLAERISPRLIISAALILGGIGLVVISRR